MAQKKLILAITACLFGNAQAAYSNTTSVPVDFTNNGAGYTNFTPVNVYAKCPNYNFAWKSNNHDSYPNASGEITSGSSLGNNAYEVVFQFSADACPPVSNLDQAAIIGVQSPEASTYILYDSNQKISLIESSCNWEARFIVNGIKEGNTVCVPPFQIHYSWFSGLAKSDYQSSFPYNSAYEYSMNCVHDNNNNAQSDFPQYCFELDGATPDVETSSSTSPAPTSTGTKNSCISTWGQCGGYNWKSSVECCEDSVCVYSSDYYSQCIPKELVKSSSSSTTETTMKTSTLTTDTTSTKTDTKNSCISTWGQCGGYNWKSSVECCEDSVCVYSSDYYSQCIPKELVKSSSSSTTETTMKTSTLTTDAASAKTESLQTLYGQCGGINWKGATACATGTCSSMNPYYYQCVNTAAW